MKASKTSAPSLPLDIDQITPLLGGISPATFMRKYWQKKPLLIRQAMPGVKPPIERSKLFALAESDEVESRLIVQTAVEGGKVEGAKARKPKKADAGWRLSHGPLSRRSLPPMTQAGWTLLVQGLDLHVPAAYDMLQQFRFVPDARLDDLMISYATDGGGVGPHFDSYDVFLLQVHGQRRWRIGQLSDPTLQADVPLKILTNFVPEHEWVLEPGDMLYLPPRYAHDGIAEGECQTYSIGFRSPSFQELGEAFLQFMADSIDLRVSSRTHASGPRSATAAAPWARISAWWFITMTSCTPEAIFDSRTPMQYQGRACFNEVRQS